MWLRSRRKVLYILLCSIFAFLFVRFWLGNGTQEIQNGSRKEGMEFSGSPTAFSSPNKRERFGARDIHVVIGYYQGDNLPWASNDNISNDILNSNMFSPDPKAGENGEAVIIPSFESPKMNKLFQINRFNVMASDRIPLNRSLPDVRRKSCLDKEYFIDNLPTTSIIIVFHNEAFSTLLRTVHSVINRSPRRLIQEIILVDDASQRSFLKTSLESHIARLPLPVRVIRSESRVGLIKARLLGAKEAKGQTLTFLDAHCECTLGWLEPLLTRIKENRKSIVSPVIDIINDETFQYVRSFELHQGGFNWELHFRWFSLPSDLILLRQGDPTLPFQTPVMAGGLFSIEKDFFYELGSYDEKMEIWGGENLEISFRGWMCGAVLEIVPCSHVGHLFRKSSPYSFPGGVGDILHSNLARVAMVWMDEWKDFYFKLHPEVAAQSHNQSITSRLDLRKRLKCKSFKWFLDTIWPTHFFPNEDRFFGKIRNLKSDKCLQTPRNSNFGQPYGPATVSECILELYPSQLFILTPDGYIKTDDSVCLDAPDFKKKHGSQVRIMACNSLPRQRWKFDHQKGLIIHALTTNKCLDLPSKDLPGNGLSIRNCEPERISQQWVLEKVKWK